VLLEDRSVLLGVEMECEMIRSLAVWESEGGAIFVAPHPLHGDPFQVDWAERIRPRVNAEFDRARAFHSVAEQQNEFKRSRTEGTRAASAR